MFKKAVTTLTLATLIGLPPSISNAQNNEEKIKGIKSEDYISGLVGASSNTRNFFHFGVGFGVSMQLSPSLCWGVDGVLREEMSNINLSTGPYLRAMFNEYGVGIGTGISEIEFANLSSRSGICYYFRCELFKYVSEDFKLLYVYQKNVASSKLLMLGYPPNRLSISLEKNLHKPGLKKYR